MYFAVDVGVAIKEHLQGLRCLFGCGAHNLGLRAGYSSSLFGDSGLDNSVARLQLVNSWHRLSENMRKLRGGH